MALSAPILSRFDLFFVVLDECNPVSDNQVARHILNVHRCQEEAVRPPFSKEQMQRYIRIARTINPTITPESQRVLVDCYRKLRQGDTLGRSRSAYRITVRQLESMIRLSEALARLHCDDEIQPSYVREAFRLLKTSIIQVETSDVDMGDDDDDDGDEGPDNGGGAESGAGRNESQAMNPESQENFDPETQAFNHPGEYGSEAMQQDAPEPPEENEEEEQPEKKSKKTKISFEEYEAITNAVAAHLRSMESDDEDTSTKHMTWKEIVEWYIEQMEHEIGDSMERLTEMRKKINLVIRRLVNVDQVLVTIGNPPANKKEEQRAVLAVHPNYEAS